MAVESCERRSVDVTTRLSQAEEGWQTGRTWVVYGHRFRHTFATWAIEHEAREIDVQYLLGHSTPAMVRRYSATYNSEKAAQAHARCSPGAILAREMRSEAVAYRCNRSIPT